MLLYVVQVFWISIVFVVFVISLLLPVEVDARQPFSSNPDDYDFGWLATGIYQPGQVPNCTYCVNAALDNSFDPQSAADAAHGQYWNRSVELYRCDGVQTNEIWAYQVSTGSIILSNFTTLLCVDAVLWSSTNRLKLLPCNSSVVSQKWTFEGNRLRNGLAESNVEPWYLWGHPPNAGTDPGNQNYTFPLVISSSTPSDNGLGPFSPNFTFLPAANLVDIKSKRFTTLGLLEIVNFSKDRIVNGDFERSTIQAGTDITTSTYIQTVPSYLALCGWVIDYGPIDYVKAGLFPSADLGQYSVHLNTYTDAAHDGSISQTFITEEGKEYNLSFYLNGMPTSDLSIQDRPSCSAAYQVALLQLRVTDAIAVDGSAVGNETGLVRNFTFLAQTQLPSAWIPQTLNFRALTNLTTISFRSLNFNESCGPMIDAVDVSPTTRSGGSNTVRDAVGGSIVGLVVLIAILGAVFGTRYYKKRGDYSGLFKTDYARVYTVKELSVATKKFSSALGEGAFGTVYKAEFPDGTTGAVKVEKQKGLNSSSTVLASDEIAVLLRVHHRTLVNLIGFCIHKGRHMLVFEYLPNGSLHRRLHRSKFKSPSGGISKNSLGLDQVSPNIIPWKQRVKIAADVARGLEYLHHEADPPVVHRDVKSQNILLTATDSAKLADFGLSKAAPVDATSFQSIETMVRGSLGYMDPQYFLSGVFSTKSDVYSFGVVLLELISGHPAIYNAESLDSWAAPYMTSPSLYPEMVDKKLNGEFDANELESLVVLSNMCRQEDGKLRPNMRQVVAFLNSRLLATVGEKGSSRTEWMEETIASESFNKKMKPMSIDFE